jgi:hypothetical protein
LILQLRAFHLRSFLKLLVLGPIFALCLHSAFAMAQELDYSERYISIQMGRVAGAKFYEVEISPFETRGIEKGFLFKIYDEEPRVYARLKPGKYAVRTRSLSEDNSAGEWGAWTAFEVEPKKLDVLYPSEGEKISPKAKDQEKIIFHWPGMDGGSNGYHFILKQDGNIIDMHDTKTGWTEAEVVPEKKYEWSVTPIRTDEQATLNWSTVPVHKFEMLAAPTNGKVVTIDVAGDPNAQLYQYELVKFSKDNKPGGASLIESKDTRFKMRLAPGLYELRVRSVLVNRAYSEWSRPERFYVKLPYPELITPENRITMVSVDNWHNPVDMTWSAVPDANKYILRVLEKDTKNVMAVRETSSNFASVDLEHDKTYEWSVTALSYGEKPDEAMLKGAPSRVIFITKYSRLDLSQAEESSHLYGWYRHWVSNIHYVGKNYDKNSQYDQQIFGGTGELAMGWWNRHNGWGMLVDGSLSGFLIEDKYFNYMAAGLNVGRRIKVSDTGRLRYWFGVEYFEFPDFVVSPYENEFHYARVKTIGPQVQVSYLGDFNEEWGYHVYLQGYYPVMATRTPTGNSFMPAPSGRFGLLATWKYSDDVKLMAGYSYRYETYGYSSNSYLGARNSSEYAGHFLNFAIEIGLSKQKFK